MPDLIQALKTAQMSGGKVTIAQALAAQNKPSPFTTSTKSTTSTASKTAAPFVGPPAPTQTKPPAAAPKASTPSFGFQTPLDKLLAPLKQQTTTPAKATTPAKTIQGFPAAFVKSVNPPTPATTYESIKSDINSNIATLNQNAIKIIMSPPNATIKDTSGKEYTKKEAIFEITKGRTSLQKNLSTVESYESKGYHIRKGTEGSFEFYKTPEEVKEEAISATETKLKAGMTGSGEQRVAGLGAWVTTGLLSWEDPLGIKSTAQAILGDSRGALRTKAAAMTDLDAALREGPLQYTLKVATGPFATVGMAFAGGAGIQVVEGRLAAGASMAKLAGSTGLKAVATRAAPFIFKGAMTATGIAFGGMMAKDVYETYKTDPLLAFAKGVTYAGAIGAGVKGYKAAGGTKGISNKIAAAEDKFYNEHPERIRMVFMKEGVPVEPKGTLPKSTKGTEWDLEGPVNRNVSNFKSTILEEPKAKTTGGFEYGKPEIEIFTSRGGTKFVNRVTVKKAKAYEPGNKWIAMSKGLADEIGPRLDMDLIYSRSIKGAELFAEGGKAKTRPLYSDLDLASITGRTGEVKTGILGRGRKIFDFGWKRVEYSEDISSIERGGGGGIARTKTLPIEEYDFGEVGDVFFKPSGSKIGSIVIPAALGGSGGAIAAEINILSPDLGKRQAGGELQVPGFKSEGDLDVDLLATWQEPGFKNKPDTVNKVIDVFDQGFDIIQDQKQDFTYDYKPGFDFVTEQTQETVPDFETARLPGFAFKAPGFALTGFDEESGDLISVFGRTRSYRTGNLHKALKDFGAMFS